LRENAEKEPKGKGKGKGKRKGKGKGKGKKTDNDKAKSWKNFNSRKDKEKAKKLAKIESAKESKEVTDDLRKEVNALKAETSTAAPSTQQGTSAMKSIVMASNETAGPQARLVRMIAASSRGASAQPGILIDSGAQVSAIPRHLAH
jgi:hypothetical protein